MSTALLIAFVSLSSFANCHDEIGVAFSHRVVAMQKWMIAFNRVEGGRPHDPKAQLDNVARAAFEEARNHLDDLEASDRDSVRQHLFRALGAGPRTHATEIDHVLLQRTLTYAQMKLRARNKPYFTASPTFIAETLFALGVVYAVWEAVPTERSFHPDAMYVDPEEHEIYDMIEQTARALQSPGDAKAVRTALGAADAQRAFSSLSAQDLATPRLRELAREMRDSEEWIRLKEVAGYLELARAFAAQRVRLIGTE